MDTADVVMHMHRSLYLVLVLSLPAIGVAAAVGLLFAVVQALTQLQEQTLAFAAKLIATLAVLALTLRWIGVEVYQFTLGVFDAVQYVGR